MHDYRFLYKLTYVSVTQTYDLTVMGSQNNMVEPEKSFAGFDVGSLLDHGTKLLLLMLMFSQQLYIGLPLNDKALVIGTTVLTFTFYSRCFRSVFMSTALYNGIFFLLL